MATFKVGQRVRIVAQSPNSTGSYVGEEGTIVGAYDGQRDWIVEFGKWMHEPTDIAETQGVFFNFELAPLTDPKADEFIARLKKLGSEPAILSPSQLKEVRGA